MVNVDACKWLVTTATSFVLSQNKCKTTCLQTVQTWWRVVKYLLRYSVGCANFCPVFLYSSFATNSENSLLKLQTNLHHVFTQCSGISTTINVHNYKMILHFASEHQSRVKAVNFDMCKKGPWFSNAKNQGYGVALFACLAISVEHWIVMDRCTDRQTDRHMMTAYIIVWKKFKVTEHLYHMDIDHKVGSVVRSDLLMLSMPTKIKLMFCTQTWSDHLAESSLSQQWSEIT